MTEGIRITSENQLVIGRVYKKHVDDDSDCGNGCLLRWTTKELFVLDKHSCEADECCKVDGKCGDFSDNSQINIWLTFIITECEITGRPMVIGEL